MFFKKNLEDLKDNTEKMKNCIKNLGDLIGCEEVLPAPLENVEMSIPLEEKNETFKQLKEKWIANHGLVN